MVHLGQQSIIQAVSITQKQYESLSRMHGDFPGGTVVKNSLAKAGIAGDAGSIPGSGSSPGVGNGNPLQYSYLENSMDRGVWWATVHGLEKGWTRMSTQHTHTNTLGQIELDRNLGII